MKPRKTGFISFCFFLFFLLKWRKYKSAGLAILVSISSVHFLGWTHAMYTYFLSVIAWCNFSLQGRGSYEDRTEMLRLIVDLVEASIYADNPEWRCIHLLYLLSIRVYPISLLILKYAYAANFTYFYFFPV